MIHCRLCDSRTAHQVVCREQEYDIAQCSACGFITTDPLPTSAELSEYYSRRYFDGTPAQAAYWDEKRTGLFRQAQRLLSRFGLPRRGARVLDVGCAYGAFVQFLAANGVEAEGVDVSSVTVASARRLGLRVHEGVLGETFRTEPEHYDAVTFLDVLEHLPDFKRQLREAHRALRPGGLLLVRVPNASFHVLKLRVLTQVGLQWRYGFFTPPDHVNHFRRSVLAGLLRELDFADRIMTNGYPAVHGAVGRVLPLLGIWLTARGLEKMTLGRWVVGNSLVAVAAKPRVAHASCR